MKPRTWAAIVGGALTIMIGAALVIAEDHEDHFSGVDATTTTVPVVIETTTTAAVETTPTTAPPAYGVVWHTGIVSRNVGGGKPVLELQESVAVADGLIYHSHQYGGIRVHPIDRIIYFDYELYGEDDRYYNEDHPDRGTIQIHLETHPIYIREVSDLAGLVDELEYELGD